MFLLNYENRKIDIDFNFNVEDIAVTTINIITGDEILNITTKDGKFYSFDSDIDYLRAMDFFDGSYNIIVDGKWVVDPIRWANRGTSYDYYEQSLDM